VVEESSNIEIVEKIWMLCHTVGVMLGHELEEIYKLSPAHYFHLSLEGTDHILELVVHNQSSITLLGVFHNLIGD
jgi:hypothetical protein